MDASDASDHALSSAGSVGTRPPHRHVVRERLDDHAPPPARRQATLVEVWSSCLVDESKSEHGDPYWETGIAD